MKAKIPKPPKRASTKGKPPQRSEAKDNITKPDPNEIVPLNFRVPAEFKRDFKIASASQGITQSKLLQHAFKAWKEKFD